MMKGKSEQELRDGNLPGSPIVRSITWVMPYGPHKGKTKQELDSKYMRQGIKNLKTSPIVKKIFERELADRKAKSYAERMGDQSFAKQEQAKCVTRGHRRMALIERKPWEPPAPGSHYSRTSPPWFGQSTWEKSN
jgi:hypothetical protein